MYKKILKLIYAVLRKLLNNRNSLRFLVCILRKKRVHQFFCSIWPQNYYFNSKLDNKYAKSVYHTVKIMCEAKVDFVALFDLLANLLLMNQRINIIYIFSLCNLFQLPIVKFPSINKVSYTF